MKINHLLTLGPTLLFCLILIAGTTACAQAAGPAGPRAWFDAPLDGSTVSLGTPVPVVSHAYAQEGVTEMFLAVNDEPYWRGAPTKSGTFAETAYEWRPDKEGDYVLLVKAHTASGAASLPATVRVKVVGKRTPTATATAIKPPSGGITPVAGQADLAIVSVEAIVAGYKDGTPFCNTRVVYRNAGTVAVPREFTIQFHVNRTPQWASTFAGGLAPGAIAEAIFVYQFVGSPYIGINLDSTDVIDESDETNNAFANARICGGTPPPVITRTPTPTGEPSVRPSATSIAPATDVAPVPPPLTHTPTRTRTNTPWPPATVKFGADKTSLVQGECTNLYWDVTNATKVTLDGQGVAGHGTRQVCPDKTTTYNLHVQAPRGNVDKSVTITVTAPPDKTPPPVPSPRVPANGLAIACKSSQTLAWLPVSDPSGIAGYYVKLERQITANNWQSVRGWGPVTDKQVTASVQCGVKYRWAVRAQDGAGNYSDWSAWSSFAINLN